MAACPTSGRCLHQEVRDILSVHPGSAGGSERDGFVTSETGETCGWQKKNETGLFRFVAEQVVEVGAEFAFEVGVDLGAGRDLAAGQADLEGGPLARRGLDGDGAAHVGDQAMDDSQAQAGVAARAAGQFALGGKEGLEDAVEQFGRDAGPAVADPQDHLAVGLAEGDPQHAAIRHGLAGVGRQAIEHLQHRLAGHGIDVDGIEVQFQADGVLGQVGLDSLAEEEDHLGKVGQVSVLALGAGEDLELADEFAGPAGGGTDAFEGTAVDGGVVADEGEVDAGEHAAQEVAEVVGNGAGEFAQGGHLDGAEQFAVEGVAVVGLEDPGGDTGGLVVGVVQGLEVHGGPGGRVVGAAEVEKEFVLVVAGQHVLEQADEEVAAVLGGQVEDGAALPVVGLEVEELAGGTVDEGELQVAVDQEDRDGRFLEGFAKQPGCQRVRMSFRWGRRLGFFRWGRVVQVQHPRHDHEDRLVGFPVNGRDEEFPAEQAHAGHIRARP